MDGRDSSKVLAYLNTFRRSSEQPFDFTMHYNRHRESTYVLVNRLKNVANHLSGACRIRRQLMQITAT
jgi:hypothetical protein